MWQPTDFTLTALPRSLPTLVLLPGMDGTGELFAPLIAALGREVSTIIVRYPDRPLSYAGHKAIARAALPADQPFVLLGESFSGPIAVSLAAAAPAGMIGYILSTSFVDCPWLVLKVLRPVLGLVSPKLVPSWVTTHLLMGRFATTELRRAQQRALDSVSARALVARLKSVAEVNVSEKLKSIDVPGLYLRATEDRLVPAKAVRKFQRLAPKARIIDLEGPHFLLQANSHGAARKIRAFLVEALELSGK